MKKNVLSSLNQPKGRNVKNKLNFYHYNMFDVIRVEKVIVRSVNEMFKFSDTVKMQNENSFVFRNKSKLKLFQVSYVGELLRPVIVKKC
jgi:hypothetical protein